MKIVSYNVLQGGFRKYGSKEKYPEKMDKIVGAVKAIRADFVSLVDVFRWHEIFSSEEIGKMFGYKNVYQISLEDTIKSKYRNEFGITVMTNLEVKSFEKCWLDTRNCIKTTLVYDDQEIEIFSVYLNNRAEDIRIDQTKKLLKLANINKPTIICGDLNAIKKGEVEGWAKVVVWMAGWLRPKWRREKKIVWDMMRGEVIGMMEKAGWIDSDKKAERTIPSGIDIKGIFGPFLRLDYIFYSDKLKLIKFEVVKGGVYEETSDHYPIVGEFDTK
jgi:endonuclease/exonuclease/phosphatase family metal-dependent hydrolase